MQEPDAYVFRLFGVTRDEVAYLMDNFPVVKRQDEARFGEYHTKRVILEVHDERG